MPRAQILVVDDEQPFRDVLCSVLEKQGHSITGAGSAEEALPWLDKKPFDLAVCDLRLPGLSGLELLRKTRQTVPQLAFIVITAYGDIETAVEAMKLGAVDYLTKPFLFDDLVLRIGRLLEHRSLQQSHAALQNELVARYEPRGMVGRCKAIEAVRGFIRRVAPTTSSVLITGESGTGKEVVARAIHRLSERRDQRLVTLNCAALPETLLESELFGHSRGAFTGASRDREGMFQAADGGTLFLDEIGAMPGALQSKILRAVEAREVVPLGTTSPVRADVRILAATSTDLAEAMRSGKFLDALYYRLSVFEIRMPPLRDRKEDIPELVEHFLGRLRQELKKRVSRVGDEAMAMLMAYPWPGNVRELENAIERAVILTDGDTMEADALPMSLQQTLGGPAGRPLDLRTVLHRCEREHITAVLAITGQDKVRAARMLGISLSSLYRKVEQPEPAAPAAPSAAAPEPAPPATGAEAEPEPAAPAAPLQAGPGPAGAAQAVGTPEAPDAAPGGGSAAPLPHPLPADSPDRNKWRRAKPPF